MGTTTVRLDDEDEANLDLLAAQHGGRSAAIRHAVNEAAVELKRQEGLREFIATWEEDLGPFDDAEVQDMADYLRLNVTSSIDAASRTDDLQKVDGIGPVTAKQLAGYGIRTWEQLAALDTSTDRGGIPFPERIKREQWAAQAKELMKRRSRT